MIRKVFVLDGLVLSVAQVGSEDTADYVTHPGSDSSYLVSDPAIDVGSGYLCTVVDGVARFKPPAPPPTEIPVATPQAKNLTPVEFKLLFTGHERIAIRAARATDALVDDFFDIIDDPRLTEVDMNLGSTVAALQHLVSLGLLKAERLPDILSGKLL